MSRQLDVPLQQRTDQQAAGTAHMARANLTNLQTYQTPKERVRSAFWGLLSVVVSCALSWDLSVYSIKLWESGRASGLIVPVLLAIALVHTLRLSMRARQHWWPLLPAIIAVAAPIALHLIEHRVQPNSRFLSDAYESVLGRASSSPAKPGR
jgi:hypothetical protein